ncbi:MAG: hypothetical protein IPI56_10590 [Elusimicrobia bacterium]|nr:hypothetical protein [Elusimicrobiota bacterium]
MSENTTETIELTAPEVANVEVESKPTREVLKERGWTKDELDAAEKRGMVAKEEVKEEKKEPVQEVVEPKEEPKAEEKVEEEVQEKKPTGLPDFTFKTPEQEKAWADAFGPGTPQRGLYFRMKSERRERQKIEAERDLLAREVEELRARTNPAVKSSESEGDMASLLSDETGGEEDKPLTLRQLKEMEAKKAKEEQEMTARQVRLTEVHREQEEYARTVYQDFDDAVVRAREVMQNLDEVVPEKWRQSKVVKLMKDLQVAAREADKLGPDDYNAAHIAYEIAQYHPDHGSQRLKNPKRRTGAIRPKR